MKELEKNTYVFSVEAIGFAKTLEKKEAQKKNAGIIKEYAGTVYRKLADAQQEDETEVFADSLRKSYQAASQAKDLFEELEIENDVDLQDQQKKLLEKIKIIVSKMDEIIKKLIY